MGGFLGLLLGAGGPVTVSMVPGDITNSGTVASNTFIESISVVGGVATSYVWSFSGTGGSWGAISGQGTANASISVSVGPGGIATGTLSCAVTVAGNVYNVSAELYYERT